MRPVITPADRIRLRFRELLHQRGISQQKLCDTLTAQTGEPWFIQRMSKLLNGKNELKVGDLIVMCRAAEISLIELFREPGRELIADLTPTELRLIHALRDYPAIMQPLVDVVATLTPPRRKVPREILRERMRQARREE